MDEPQTLPRSEEAPGRAALDGLRYLRDHRAARRLVIGISATNVCITPLMTIGLAMIASRARWGSVWVGYGEACVALSALAGSALAPRLTRGRPARLSFMVLIVEGVAVACVPQGGRPLYLMALAVIGVTAGIASVHLSSIYLTTIDPTYLGRVGSWVGAIDLMLGPVVTPMWTGLASRTSLPTTGALFGTAGAIVALVLIAITWDVGPAPAPPEAQDT